MAHAVRLTANRGLHDKKKAIDKSPEVATVGASDGGTFTGDLDTFTEDDVKEMIAFTREFFHHVYVMPALLNAHNKRVNPTQE